MKSIYFSEIYFVLCTFYLSIANVKGVCHGCNKGDGTEGLTDCISSHHFMHNTPPHHNYQPAVCMKSSTLRSKGLKCGDKSNDFCWFHCSLTSNSSLTECQCDPQKNCTSLNSIVPIDCYFPKENDCDWYQRCLEARIPCESTEHRYALSYAKKYCNLFNESYNKFRNEVQRWIDAVRKCLQQKLVHALFPQSTMTCETLKKTAFYTHTGCYLRPTPNVYMCNLSPFDFVKISWIIKEGFLTDFSDMVDGFVSIVKECFSKMFTSYNVARLILYVKNVTKTTAGKIAKQVSNKIAKIQRWSSNVMYLADGEKLSTSNSIRIQILIATKDSDRIQLEKLISAVKDSAYSGGLTSLQLENETVRVKKIEKSVRPDGLHASFSIDIDHTECTKEKGYCRNKSLKCDLHIVGEICGDGKRCCISGKNKDLPCITSGGWCQDSKISSCDRYESGKCGGNSDRKCCVAHKECKNVKIYKRSEWNADDASEIDYLTDSVSLFFIHHTVTPTCNSSDNCSKIVKGIQNFHMGEQRNADIGYNFLVGNNGIVYEGRGWSRVGAHTYGYNNESLALSFIGNFRDQLPNELALDAAKNLIKCGLKNEYIKSSYTLSGHRDVSKTECPGNMLYKEIQKWENYKKIKKQT